jgi:hypothetical protein
MLLHTWGMKYADRAGHHTRGAWDRTGAAKRTEFAQLKDAVWQCKRNKKQRICFEEAVAGICQTVIEK